MWVGPKTLSIGLAVISGALLMVTSQLVQNLEIRKQELRAQIEREEEAIRFLESEWAYLNRPDRLQNLVKAAGLQVEEMGNARAVKESNVLSYREEVPVPIMPSLPGKKPFDAKGVDTQTVQGVQPVKPASIKGRQLEQIEPAAGAGPRHENQSEAPENTAFEGRKTSSPEKFDALINKFGDDSLAVGGGP